MSGPVDRCVRSSSRLSSISDMDSERTMSADLGKTRMRLCRVFHRARTRAQKRRCVAWGLAVCVALLIYFNILGVDILAQHQHQTLAKDVHPRKPTAIKTPELPKIDEELDFDHDLMPDLAPAILHYIWCGRRPFEYRHYLAIKSANRAVRPDKVFFHYEEQPVLDAEGYYTWFNDTLLEIDHLLPKPLNQTLCPHIGTAERYILVFDILEIFGGIYVPEDSIWLDFPVHLRTSALVTGVVASSPIEFMEGIVVGKKGGFKPPTTPEELLVTLSLGKHEHGGIKPCVSTRVYATDNTGDKICVRANKNIFPKDIWDENSKFAMLVKVVDYRTASMKIRHSMTNPMPRIGHYVCIDCLLKFKGYLSMLSAIYVAGLNKVFIHGVREPSGQWWKRLKQDPRFIYVYREYPESMYDKAVMTPSLAVGIMRVSILLKYGGVYQDFSTLWTSKIPDDYFGYEAIASPDWHLYGQWPDSVNHGVLMTKRNSRYLQKLRNVLQQNRDQEYWFIDHFLSYKEVERCPSCVWLNRHLQVKCLNHNCHPTWQPNYHSGLMQNKPGGPFNWHNDTLSLHWMDSFPELDLDMVRYTSGIAIEASRNIFQSAGINFNSPTF